MGIPTSEPLVSITETEFKALQEASDILDALYAGGVDNWEGFDEALESVEADCE